MSMQFDNKRFIVTGAASGIGAATATLLKQRGAYVIAFDRRAPDASAADDYIQFDQGDFASIDAAVRKAPDKIDALVNIAGIPPKADCSPPHLLMVNFYGIRALTEQLAERLTPGGAILNMSSHAGNAWRENVGLLKQFLPARDKDDIDALARRHGVVMDGLDAVSAYPLSKQLLNLWTVQSFPAMEKAGVRMNAAASAGVQTDILSDFLTSFGEQSAARIRAIGIAAPSDIASVIAFLVSDQSAWIKSAIIPVDGGASAMAAANKFGFVAGE
ncbi:MAG: SDR family oxidoreductase [Alphaproteobacteria bacterium]|nr:SDR family oxidoreductase [Alphaproteobacteria bacterium]